MNKFLRNKEIVLCGFFTSFRFENEKFETYKEASGLFLKDPWKRVQTIFRKSNMGDYHPDLVHTLQVLQTGAFVGGLFGGVLEVKKSTENYMRTKDTNIYKNTKEFYRKLADQNILSFGRGIIKWAPIFSIFMGSFTLIASCIQLYRYKYGIIEYLGAGFLVGSFAKFFYGFKGMLSGGIVGGVLGSIYGVIMYISHKLFKVEPLETKYLMYEYEMYQKELVKMKKEPENLNKPLESPSNEPNKQETQSNKKN